MDSDAYARERQTKQDFLKVEIVDKGYNTADFAQYLVEQRGNLNRLATLCRQWDRHRCLAVPRTLAGCHRISSTLLLE